jgi:hypothetical protein
MVRVALPGNPVPLPMGMFLYDAPTTLQAADYLFDRYEVTNDEFQRFVEAGGYENPDYWKHEFARDGEILPRVEAMALFRDKTGRQGPSTWEYGTYPEGQPDFPVTGVSWYEAAAYAEYAGKELPTVYHWAVAGSCWTAEFLIPLSNFGSGGLAPVGRYAGSLGWLGTYDTAGNAREWCSNAVNGKPLALGGAWSDPAYHFIVALDARPPFDRDERNGFRCMKRLTSDSVPEYTTLPLKRLDPPDWEGIKPFSEDEFRIMRGLANYPPTPLESKIELVNETGHYRMEKITFAPAYDGPRMVAYLFLPKSARPPYQVVLFFPGVAAMRVTDSADGASLMDMDKCDFFIRDGRAVMYPVYYKTYERGGQGPSSAGPETDELESWFRYIKDARRSMDYLESRPDIDAAKLAACGFSMPYVYALPAYDSRIKVILLISNGVFNELLYKHALRVTIPALMLNGRYDQAYRYDIHQVPLFRALATPPEQKRHKLFPCYHMLSDYHPEMIRECLGWLDKYLGPARRAGEVDQ